jgi:zinc transporter, ZIP family
MSTDVTIESPQAGADHTSGEETAPGPHSSGSHWWRAWVLLPLIALAVLVAVVVRSGDGLLENLGTPPPAVDEVTITRVVFERGDDGSTIELHVTNPQREPITIGAVDIDDAIVPFRVDGSARMDRLDRRVITVDYEWVDEEPYHVGVTSSSGIRTGHDVPAAVEEPGFSGDGLLSGALIGLLVGVVPVALGLLWLPALRRARPVWITAFMALTAGMLTFLAVDAFEEALEFQGRLPGALGGVGLILVGAAGSFLLLSWISNRFSSRGRGDGGLDGGALALLVAIGIGLHNLGEGLAIGSAIALGALPLGAFLIVGFMVHNVSEGLGIASPLARERVSIARLATLALIAGLPAVAGIWIGRYLVNDVVGTLFFAFAIGAAVQVVIEGLRFAARRSEGRGLLGGPAVGGFVAGLLVMYITALLISA